jgi:glycosyltransferase involved in cell wall biosynthesis
MAKKLEREPEISIILPCRNEEKALPSCLKLIKEVIKRNKLDAEIIVSDSSTDKSPEIAIKEKVRLVKHDKEGYGIAYLEGFNAAKGKYLFMADADGSYDFNEIPKFVKYLREGYDFVIGDRFGGKMDSSAMPFLHKYLGNPVLSGILRLFYGTKINDCHCGMRAISREALEKLNLRTTGMEFASEMIIKALKAKLKIKEVSIDYHERKGDSKLKSFRDGWRHLRFMLLYSPIFLFFVPGMILFLLGLEMLLLFYFGSLEIFGVRFDYHPMFFAGLLIILGYQLVFFSLFAKTYAVTHLGDDWRFMDRVCKYITIEKASIFGILVLLAGAFVYGWIFAKWFNSGFGALNEVKNSIIALVLIVLGAQTVFSSFMLSMLGIKEK